MSKFKVGDEFILTNNLSPFDVYVPVGSVGVVRKFLDTPYTRGQTRYDVYFYDMDIQQTVELSQMTPIAIVEEPVVAKFKVGDKVRIVNDECHYIALGSIGTILEVGPEFITVLGPYSTNPDEDIDQWVTADQIELVEETKQMQVPFTITSNMISVFVDGKSFFVASTDGAFAELKEHLKGQHDVETIRNLVDKKAFITKVTEGLVTVTDTEVLYKGQPVHSALTQKLLTLVAEGFDVRPWARFMDNLMQNPSYKSREALFKFLEKWMAPITEDGHFLAFKNVRQDFKDIHSGTFDNSPGTIVSMPREEVNDDSNETCSAGLHAAATSYLQHFYAHGSRTVVVKINPRDVVAVPYDYDSAKMRVCQYEVLREVEQDEINRLEQQPVTSIDGSLAKEHTITVTFWDEDYRNEMNTEEDTYYEDSYYNSYDEY